MCVCVCSPLMELPPLSPGIHVRVMEEVEVVETVSRGWSGGTEEGNTHTQISVKQTVCKRCCNKVLNLLYLAPKD